MAYFPPPVSTGLKTIATANHVGLSTVDFLNIPNVYDFLYLEVNGIRASSNSGAVNLFASVDNMATPVSVGLALQGVGGVVDTSNYANALYVLNDMKGQLHPVFIMGGIISTAPAATLDIGINSTLATTGGAAPYSIPLLRSTSPINALRLTFGSAVLAATGSIVLKGM